MAKPKTRTELSNDERLTVLADLEEAETYLNLLAEAPAKPLSRRAAFSLAAIISYCRPFQSGRPQPAGGRWLYYKDVIHTPALHQFHEKLDDLRGQVMAHTVGSSPNRKRTDAGKRWTSLAEVAIPTFHDLINEVRSSLASRDC